MIPGFKLWTVCTCVLLKTWLEIENHFLNFYTITLIISKMEKIINKKVSVKRVRPNPLFEEWLTSMHEQAKTSKSKLEPTLKMALDSLSKYPLPLNSGSECRILQGFGKQLCKYIDILLERHNNYLKTTHSNGNVNSKKRSRSPTSSSSSDQGDPRKKLLTSDINKNYTETSASSSHLPQTVIELPEKEDEVVNFYTNSSSGSSVNVNKGKKSKTYMPVYKSGGYAILVALLEHITEKPDTPYITKDELIQKAQKYSEESFVRPKPDTHYTAWSNMARLVTKGLVKKVKRKKVEFTLTEEGVELAKEIHKKAEQVPSVNDIIFNAMSTRANMEACENVQEVPSIMNNTDDFIIEMEPGRFDIILLIDKNETSGLKNKNDPTVAQFNKFPDLKHEYRSLKVGDFAWIARSKANKDQELVLPYICERKRMDDLGASIKDGRFHEQKFRLRKCGIENIVYLVENFGKNQHVGLPVQSLMQALANTRVQDGYKVHITDSLTHTARFLAMMTERLTIRYKNKQLRGRADEPTGDDLMIFEYFNKSSAKTKALTAKEMFIKILLQLKGLSVEKALAITEKYPTLRSLINAYRKCSQKEGEILLAHLKYGDLNRNVGPVSSKTIYQLFSTLVWSEV